MGSPTYKYGKVTSAQVYPYLTMMSETSESPMVCCGYCSAGMACRTAKAGLGSGMASTAHPIRTKGGRPHNAGSNASELRNGAKLAHGVTLSSVAKSGIMARLRAGYAVVIADQYAKLPDYLKVQTNDFGHSNLLFGYRKDSAGVEFIGFFDPLWPQGAQGAWTKWADIDQALWADGNHSTTVVKLVAPPPPTGSDVMESFTTPAKPSTIKVIKGGKLYDNSEFTSDAQTITVDPGPRAMPLVGTVTGGYMVDYVNSSGVDQNKAYWVKSADTTGGVVVTPPHTCPPPVVCPPVPDIPAIEKAAKQEEWDTMIAVFPPRP
jgi:hypothetical protein